MFSKIFIFAACAALSAQACSLGLYDSGYSCGNIGPIVSGGYSGYPCGGISTGCLDSGYSCGGISAPISTGCVDSGYSCGNIGGYIDSGYSCGGISAPISTGCVDSGYSGIGYLGSSCGSRISSGPCPGPLPPVQAAPVVIRGPALPTVELPGPCPPPTRVLDDNCVCTKTVVNNQQVQRRVVVPSVQRYIKKSYRYVTEKVPYCAQGPCGCDNESVGYGYPTGAIGYGGCGLEVAAPIVSGCGYNYGSC